MNILVTGGAGYIGIHTCVALLEKEHKAFEEGNRLKIPFEIVERRLGDIASSYADVSKAEQELGWTAQHNIITMCKDALRFEKNKAIKASVNNLPFIVN